MTSRENPKVNLLEHSKAKVELYGRYLSVYLNILRNVTSVEKIFIFDLLAGEGIYLDGSKGSPIIALENLQRFTSSAIKFPEIEIWFNDNGKSEIEAGVDKIDRVERFAKEIRVDEKVQIVFSKDDYEEVLPRALAALRGTRNAKGLFFIDPYGYKDIHPDEIKQIMNSGNTEVILFLPISHMYRFAQKALRSNFPGSAPLKAFLDELIDGEMSPFSSVYDFQLQLKDNLRNYLGSDRFFVDTFILERDSNNVYCLFFLTSHIRGFEKMLETKWRIDTTEGKSHKIEKTTAMFSGIEIANYPRKLREFISQVDYRTNEELYRFGLENGFLPKHTNKVIKEWKDELEKISLDSMPARGNYIKYHSDRKIGFRIK